MDLTDKRVVVMGGTSGIGLAVAEAALREGARVIVASSRQAHVDEALARLAAKAEGYAVDLQDEAAVHRFFGGIGAFDHLVFTAGDSLQLSPLAETVLDEARHVFDVRFWGALSAAKYAAPLIRPGGSIVFTSGIAGARPQSGWALIAAICSAMEAVTRALAMELAPLRVNIVSPGFVRTPLHRDMPQAERGTMYAAIGAKLPVGRVGEAAEVADAYLFLIRQTFATGQTLIVDGGGVLS